MGAGDRGRNDSGICTLHGRARVSCRLAALPNTAIDSSLRRGVKDCARLVARLEVRSLGPTDSESSLRRHHVDCKASSLEDSPQRWLIDHAR